MSFHIYPDYGYGLMLDKSDVDKHGYGLMLDKSDVDKLCKIENVDNPYDLDDVGNYKAHYLDGVNVDSVRFDSIARTTECPEKCLMYPCFIQPTLFSKAYNNWKEVALEFLNVSNKSLLQILPPIENEGWWARHIGEYSYVQYG